MKGANRYHDETKPGADHRRPTPRLNPFKPKTRQTPKNYYEVPVDFVESAGTLVDWAVAAARR